MRGKRVLVIEDGPTLTHGEMPLRRRPGGRAAAAAPPRSWTRARTRRARSRACSRSTRTSRRSCRPWATASGRSPSWRETIAAVPCDSVLIATPIDLGRVLTIEQAEHPRGVRAGRGGQGRAAARDRAAIERWRSERRPSRGGRPWQALIPSPSRARERAPHRAGRGPQRPQLRAAAGRPRARQRRVGRGRRGQALPRHAERLLGAQLRPRPPRDRRGVRGPGEAPRAHLARVPQRPVRPVLRGDHRRSPGRTWCCP